MLIIFLCFDTHHNTCETNNNTIAISPLCMSGMPQNALHPRESDLAHFISEFLHGAGDFISEPPLIYVHGARHEETHLDLQIALGEP